MRNIVYFQPPSRWVALDSFVILTEMLSEPGSGSGVVVSYKVWLKIKFLLVVCFYNAPTTSGDLRTNNHYILKWKGCVNG